MVAVRRYDAGDSRRYSRRRGIRSVIPEKRVPVGKRRRRGGRPPHNGRDRYHYGVPTNEPGRML